MIVLQTCSRFRCRPADPVGVCLALEGRLNSADGREALAGALRQASGEGRCASSSNSSAKSAGIDSGAAHAGQTAPDAAPRCLSAQAHQLSGDCLSAFAAAAAAEQQSTGSDDGISDNHCGDHAFSTASSSLSKQDTLAPAAFVAANSGNVGGVLSAGGSQQRPLVTAAIERTSTATLDANGGVDHGAGTHDPSCTCPPYAVKSTCGKRPNMEDTYALCPNICELPMSPMSQEYADKLPHRIAGQFETHRQDFPPEQAAAATTAVPRQAPLPHQQTQAQQGAANQQQVTEQQQQQQQAVPGEEAEGSAAAFAGAAHLPGQLADAAEGELSSGSLSGSSDGGASVEKLHFFGVYDGHGGIEASQHCAQRLHYHLSKAVAEMASVWLTNAGDDAASPWNPEVRKKLCSLAVQSCWCVSSALPQLLQSKTLATNGTTIRHMAAFLAGAWIDLYVALQLCSALLLCTHPQDVYCCHASCLSATCVAV